MPIFNFGSPNVPGGWTNIQNKFGIIGNTQGQYALTPSMYKGSKFYDWWHWTHGNVSSKDLVRNEKIGKDVAFFYPSAGPAPDGSRIVATVGILVNPDNQAKLEQEYGFRKGGGDYGLVWTHPLLCIVTADAIPMDEKMVFPASTRFESEGFKSVAQFKFLMQRDLRNFGDYAGDYNGDWAWGVCLLVSPPRDPDIDINFCKSSISNASSERCNQVMQRSCTADEIKSKTGSTCSIWCGRNPDLCDVIKVNFCASHPSDPFCDCINASSRASYIKEMTGMKPESRALPKVCNTKLCNERADLVDVFQTSQYLYEKNNYKCPQLQIIDQSVSVQGDNNILQTDQKVNNNNITAPTGGDYTDYTQPGSSDEGAKSYKYLYFLLLIVLVVVMVLFMGDDDEPKHRHKHRKNPAPDQPVQA
jgi:hypothetical protein